MTMHKAMLVCLMAVVLACNDDSKLNTTRDRSDAVYSVGDEDGIMNAAIENAKNSFATFKKEWKQQDSANSGYWVKLRFYAPSGKVEHMWLGNLFTKGDTLYGILDNEPVNDVGVVPGDTVQIKEEKISDWMYIRNGKLVGGYTLKVLNGRMSDLEKQQFLKDLPFSLE